MERKMSKITAALLCGLLGCVCMGGGDWLMIYGDTAHSGALSWLTAGAAQIAPWRNNLAMALAFPGVVLYGIALFAIAAFLADETARKRYRALTAFSLTPWLCLHLFYIIILYAFAWMSRNGYESAALPVAEALFSHFSWLVLVSEALMLPPYLYWGWLLLRGKSAFPRWMALSNPLVFYAVLKLLTLLMPDDTFRLAFTNGLMSESMALWFGTMLARHMRGRGALDRRRHLCGFSGGDRGDQRMGRMSGLNSSIMEASMPISSFLCSALVLKLSAVQVFLLSRLCTIIFYILMGLGHKLDHLDT